MISRHLAKRVAMRALERFRSAQKKAASMLDEVRSADIVDRIAELERARRAHVDLVARYGKLPAIVATAVAPTMPSIAELMQGIDVELAKLRTVRDERIAAWNKLRAELPEVQA